MLKGRNNLRHQPHTHKLKLPRPPNVNRIKKKSPKLAFLILGFWGVVFCGVVFLGVFGCFWVVIGQVTWKHNMQEQPLEEQLTSDGAAEHRKRPRKEVDYADIDHSDMEEEVSPPSSFDTEAMTDLMFHIAIPTYDRLDVFRRRTYSKIIKPYKLEKYVTLFIQNEKDARAYKELAPELRQERGPKGYLNILNFISQHYPRNTRIVKMDDDLAGIYSLVNGKLVHVESAVALFQKTFQAMGKSGASMGGYYPTMNAGFMAKAAAPVTTDLRFIVGSLYCFVNRELKATIDGKSDFELTIENFKRDGTVVRLNHYSMRYDYSENTERDGHDTERFLRKYGAYVKRVIPHKDGSTSFLLKKA